MATIHRMIDNPIYGGAYALWAESCRDQDMMQQQA